MSKDMQKQWCKLLKASGATTVSSQKAFHCI